MRLTTAGRLAGIMALLVGALTAPGAGTALDRVGGDDFPAAALGVVHLIALAASGWALLVLLGGVTRLPLPGVPVQLRALLFTTVLVAGVSGTAHAESAHDVAGLTLPDRPTSSVVVRPVAASSVDTITVRSGDTLWAIATAHLNDSASTADIAASCARWYAANRQVIGSDPDLIQPGQVLTPPTTSEQDAS